jgi:tetratricopeptide (TPR) repeat protein
MSKRIVKREEQAKGDRQKVGGRLKPQPQKHSRGDACCALRLRGLLHVWVIGAVFLLGLSGSLSAQTPPPAAPDSRADLPLLALFPRLPADAKKRDDPDRALFETLRGMLVNSNRFRTVTYSPTHPLIKRALLEHTLAVSDLAEPLKPEVKHQLARLLGARYILSLHASQDDASFKTDVLCEESLGQQDWRVLFTEQNTTAKTSGRKRLKFEDVVRIAADGILTRLGLPSQLDANLRSKPLDAPPTPQENLKPKETQKENQKQNQKPGPETKPKDDPNKIAAKNNNQPPVVKNQTPKTNNQPPPEIKNQKPETNPQQPAANPQLPTPNKGETKPERNTKANTQPSATRNGDANFAPFTTDNAPLRQGDPMPPVVAPPPNAARTDFEAEAARFRQSGDIANVISSLRRAINERPRDIPLRRQLVQAYLERRMIDTALAETERALQMTPKDSPEDAGLYRLRGDCLLARADVPAALTAYREAMRLAPGDITAQVSLGDALMADNQFAEAMTVYATAAKTDPKSPLPHRRLARALAGRAASDVKQYEASLTAAEQARKLTPAADTETYLEDYLALMRLMEGRLRDFLTELQATYQAKIQAKQTNEELFRTSQDLKERVEKAVDYLEKLPPAVGQDATHARYQQGGALVLQAVSLLREWLMSGETRVEESLRSAQTDALRELATARKRLDSVRPKL